MGTSRGAEGHSLFGTILHPTLPMLTSASMTQLHQGVSLRLVLGIIEDSLRIPLDKYFEIVVE